jgi:predicted  nucleic acid-binding Zn-ribbon protein
VTLCSASQEFGANFRGGLMNFLHCMTFRTICLAAVLAVSATLVPAADFTVLPTSLGLPPGPTETTTQTVFFHAVRSGTLKFDSVDVQSISGPDDTRLDTAAARLVGFIPGSGGSTVPVNIQMTRAAFARPGAYKIALHVKGLWIPVAPPQPPASAPGPTSSPIDEAVELSLTRAPAQVTINIANNSRVSINRRNPWNEGGIAVSFSVSQEGGLPVEGLKLKASSVVRSSDNELVPGTVGLLPAELTVANGAGSGTLAFYDFTRAGDFQTNVTFTAPALAKPIVVPMTIRVSDDWMLPFVTILLGVLAGATVHFLVRMWRPRQVSAYRLGQVQVRLEALAREIGAETTRREYDRLLRRIHVLNDGIDIDATTDDAVRQLDTDIKSLEDKLNQVDAAAALALSQQQKELDKTLRDLSPHIGDPGKAELAQIKADLEACRKDYEADHVETVLESINALKDALAATRKRLTIGAINTMKAEIGGLPNQDDRTALNGKAQDALNKLNESSADVGQILDALRSAINEKKGEVGDVVAEREPPVERREIRVIEAPEYHRVGAELTFAISPAPTQQTIKVVRWTLDGSPIQNSATRLTRSFPVAGKFTVAARIEYQDGHAPDDVAPLRIAIEPSETQERVGKIADMIRRADWGLLLLAVVVAAVTGLLDRYSGKSFGTVADYCWAFLWGFGIDSVVRGFSASFGRLTAKQ